MVYFDQILHTNACQYYLTIGMCSRLLNGQGFAEHHESLLINLEQHGIFELFFHSYSFYQCPATGVQAGDLALPSIILASRGLLVTVLITLEPHRIF